MGARAKRGVVFTMKIYIKKQAEQTSGSESESQKSDVKIITADDLLSKMTENETVVGLSFSQALGTHYLFQKIKGELRRYPIRIDPKTGESLLLPMHTLYNKEKGTFSTTPSDKVEIDKRPIIPTNSLYFSEDETKKLIQEIQSGEQLTQKENASCPYLENSVLSTEQQEKLYFACVTSTIQGESFSDYLKNNILSLPSSEKILRASIGDPVELNDEEQIELRAFRYEFFSPNRIAQFSKELLCSNESQNNCPTVGDILDFYTHCVQTTLKRDDKQTVEQKNIRGYSAQTRAVKVGETQHDFKNEGIYNPQGLSGERDAMYRCVMQIFVLQPDHSLGQAIQTILKNSEFSLYHYQLYTLITDMLASIETNNPTQHTEYIEIYKYIEPIYPKSGWRHLKTHLQQAQNELIAILPLEKLIYNDTRITAERAENLVNCIKPLSVNNWQRKKEILTLIHQPEMIILQKHDLLKSDYIEPILNCKHTYGMASALSEALKDLETNNLLTEQHVECVFKCDEPIAMAHIIGYLHKMGLPKTEDIKSIVSCQYPAWLTTSLQHLSSQKIQITVTPAHLNKMVNNEHIVTILNRLAKKYIEVSQSDFESLFIRKNLSDLASALETLAPSDDWFTGEFSGLLTKPVFQAVLNHATPKSLADTLRFIYKVDSKKFFTEKNIQMIAKHQDMEALYGVLTLLKDKNLLKDDYFSAIINRTDSQLNTSILALNRAGYMKGATLEHLVESADPEKMAKGLITLHQNKLTIHNRLLEKHKNPDQLAVGLEHLDKHKLLIDENINFIKQHANPHALAKALQLLYAKSLLSKENCDLLLQHAKPEELANAFIILNEKNILDTETKSFLKNHKSPCECADQLVKLSADKNPAKTSGFSFFSAKSQPQPLPLRYLQQVFEKHGGNSRTFTHIVGSATTLYGVIRNMQDKVSKGESKGASHQTLEEIGQLPKREQKPVISSSGKR